MEEANAKEDVLQIKYRFRGVTLLLMICCWWTHGGGNGVWTLSPILTIA